MTLAIDYKQGIEAADDISNKDQKGGRVDHRSYDMKMFTLSGNAKWAADLAVKVGGYPIATVNIVTTRTAFVKSDGTPLRIGDLFKFTYSPYSVSSMICRIIRIQEESIETDRITVTAIQDVNYISNIIESVVSEPKAKPVSYAVGTTEDTTMKVIVEDGTGTGDTGDDGVGDVGGEDDGGTGATGEDTDYTSDVASVEIIGTPYKLAAEILGNGDVVSITPLAARTVGMEYGYFLYMSVDGGASYSNMSTIDTFQVFGILQTDYPETFTLDGDLDKDGNLTGGVGFTVKFAFGGGDVSRIQTITRTDLFGIRNVAILGNEIITFQKITPVVGESATYMIEGVFRGRFGTNHMNHYAGERFIWAGRLNAITDDRIITGATRYFKAVPYSVSGAGSLTLAEAKIFTIDGKARKPYRPANLFANGKRKNPRYSDDIVLTWTPRVRGQGCGIGDVSTITTVSDTMEGWFEIQVVVEGSTVRTETAIDAKTWTYTEAMNISDNGALADSIDFRLRNYLTASDDMTYYSDFLTLLDVRRD